MASTIAVLAAAWVWLVPQILAQQARRILSEFGFEDLRLEVARVALDGIEVTGIALGEGSPLRIDRARIGFHWRDVLHGQVRELVLRDVQWTAHAAPGSRVAPFNELRPRAAASAGAEPPLALPELPVRRVELRRCRIRLPVGSAVEEVVCDAEITPGADAWRAAFSARVRDQLITGKATVRLSADAAEREAGLPARQAAVTVHVEELEVRATDDAWRAAGLELAVSLTGLGSVGTLRSPPAQMLRWRTIAVGDLVAGAGSLTFRVEPGPVLEVAGARWVVDAAGSMSMGPFRVDAAHAELATTLTLDQVPLGPWLDFVSQGRVAGEGRLSGWLASRVRLAPAFDIALDGGQLRATDRGVIRFKDDPQTQAMVLAQVARIAEQSAKDQGAVQKRIVESLRDFAFDALTFDLVTSATGLDLKTHVAGKGRSMPQELDLTVNLNGFDALMDMALDVKLGLSRAKQRVQQRLGQHTKE